MKLQPLDSSHLFNTAAAWLACTENSQWLDFAGGRQPITPALLRIMAQQDRHFMRLYTDAVGRKPIGILGLNNVDRESGSATLWAAAGEKSFRSRGYATFAGSAFLALAFDELGLHSINTWAVAHNPSVRIIKRLGFKYAGRQRQCHRMNGKLYDRLLFDILADEHEQLPVPSWMATRSSKSSNLES